MYWRVILLNILKSPDVKNGDNNPREMGSRNLNPVCIMTLNDEAFQNAKNSSAVSVFFGTG